MTKKHLIVVIFGIVCFLFVAFDPTPTSEEEGVEHQTAEELRLKLEVRDGAVTVDVDEDTVALDGQVLTQEQVGQVVEAVKPQPEGRQQIPNETVSAPKGDEH